MDSVSAAPDLIIVYVFQNCDRFSQVVALASTCRRLYTLWTLNTASISWQVGRAEITAFDEALIAVRATELVKDALEAGKLPDPISPKRLSGTTRKPTLQEVRSVHDLRHLVRCLEYITLTDDENDSSLWAEEILPEKPGEIAIWRENFHDAMYRSFIAGALLSRHYHEPLMSEELLRALILKRLNDVTFPYVLWREESNDPGILESLEKSPVYKFESFDEWETSFEPFTEWFVDEVRAKMLGQNPNATLLREYYDQRQPKLDIFRAFLKLEVLRLSWAYTQLCAEDKFFINDSGREHFTRANEEFFRYRHPEYKKLDSKHARKATVILFGIFQVEDISMPMHVEDATKKCLVANPGIDASADPKKALSCAVDITCLLYNLYRYSGRPNHHNGYPAPHPPLQLFSYIMRKYQNQDFEDRAFERSPEAAFPTFVRDGSILLRLVVTDIEFYVLDLFCTFEQLPELTYGTRLTYPLVF